MIKIGTDWLVKVKCPRPCKNVKNEKEHIEACSGCPYRIWEEPEIVAGFMASMCGVRIGSIGMAADLDDLGEKVSGVVRFTKEDGPPKSKIAVLKQVKAYVHRNGWKFKYETKKETLEHLDKLIEFCLRLEAKGLDIRVWA